MQPPGVPLYCARAPCAAVPAAAAPAACRPPQPVMVAHCFRRRGGRCCNLPASAHPRLVAGTLQGLSLTGALPRGVEQLVRPTCLRRGRLRPPGSSGGTGGVLDPLNSTPHSSVFFFYRPRILPKTRWVKTQIDGWKPRGSGHLYCGWKLRFARRADALGQLARSDQRHSAALVARIAQQRARSASLPRGAQGAGQPEVRARPPDSRFRLLGCL